MKKFLIPLLLLISTLSFSQEIKKFYDWQWKECEPGLARFITLINQTDSGWQRKDFFLGTKKIQMSGLYSDESLKIRNGMFTYVYANGRLSSKGRYVNNKRQGLWLYYHNNGMMSDSTVYENGEVTGTSMGWHDNGYPQDSIVVVGEVATEAHWFDNGNVSSAGHSVKGKRVGPWKFFHKNGRLAAQETFEADKIVSAQYFDEDGAEEKPIKSRDAEFKGGSDAWKKFLDKNLYFPDQYRLTNSDRVTVVIVAAIDEDGKVGEVYVDIPFDPRFDNIAVNVMKKSPPWVPAISHNRRVKFYVRQPITFVQDEE